MAARHTCLAFAWPLAFSASLAGAEEIVSASYADPVERYGHFALGRPYEYARLTASTDAGRQLELRLAQDEVFEDLVPRLVRLASDAPPELLVIVSQRDGGARLALVRLAGERLEMGAQSPAIGMPNRWLNPVGVADLDGDGRAEIAAVITPHIGGPLKIYRRDADRLIEVATLDGFSNHVYGSPELGLSLPLAIAGRTRLLVPDTTRMRLRVIALDDGRLVETGRCALSAPIIGAIQPVSSTRISIGLASGRRVISLDACAGR